VTKKYVSLLLILAGLLLGGCSSTTMQGIWVDQQFAGSQIDNVMVVGIVNQDIIRRQYEESLVKELQTQNRSADTSYQLFGTTNLPSKEELKALLVDGDFKEVIITRIAKVEEVTMHHPGTTYVTGDTYRGGRGYYGRYGGYYGQSRTITSTPATTSTAEVVILETNLYDVASEQLIWSGQSETFIINHASEEIEPLVKKIVASLKKNRLL